MASKQAPDPPPFEILSYRISLDTADSNAEYELNRSFSISVFDNPSGTSAGRHHGILVFHDDKLHVGKPTYDEKGKVIILHYKRSDFELLRAFLETSFAGKQMITCFFKRDPRGRTWGGVTGQLEVKSKESLSD